MLLAPELAPITFAVGFLEAPLAEVAAGLRDWFAEQKIRRRVSGQESLPLAAALARLTPLGAPDFRELWIATTSPRWRTAFFSGFVNGTDPFPPVSYLARRLGCQGLSVGERPQLPDCYGDRHITLYGPGETEWLNVEWSVRAMNDGGRWVFQRSGPEQPFEEPAHYTAARVRDRFTAEMLRRYCAALAVPLDPASFGPACVVVRPKWRFGPQRTLSLAEARAGFGLDHAGG